MDVSEKFVSEFNKLKSNCAASGQDEPKITTELRDDHYVRICMSVILPGENKKRDFFYELLISQLDVLSQAYIDLFEIINLAWDRLAVKGKDD